jgi:hypothetical protein
VNSLEIDPNRYSQIFAAGVYHAPIYDPTLGALLSRGAAEISANRQLQKGLEIDSTRVRL